MLRCKPMKQRSTTPVSTLASGSQGRGGGLVTKSLIVASAVLMTVASPITFYGQAMADQYDDQINALRSEIGSYQQQAAVLNAQAKTLQDELTILDGQKSAIQAQIKISETRHAQLVAQIKETKEKIESNKESLGLTLANIYADDSITPLEMLASSKSIGDFVDKQEYRSAMRDQLTETIEQINKLKTELEKQRTETERVLKDQQAQNELLVQKEAERAKLLADTQGQEAAYQTLSADRESKISELRSQQAAALASRARSNGGYTSLPGDGSRGGYPSLWANAPMNSYVDNWGMYSRQCVSYVAFKVQQAYGNMPYWGGVGNANQWPGNARAAGIPTGTTPKPGAVGVVSSGYYGHVAWVESVNPNGTINISHFNVGWNGEYAYWANLSPSYFDTYIYFGG